MIKTLIIIFLSLIFLSCNQLVFSHQIFQKNYVFDKTENTKLRQWWKSIDSDWQWLFLGKFGYSSKNQNYTNLKKFAEIKNISCDSIHLMTLKPLEVLSKLEILEMPNVLIKDIAPLKNLKSLKKIILNSNGIENIKSLSGLKNLKVLNLSLTEVRDLTPLKNLYNLEELYLDENTINSLKPLYNLKKLKILSIIGTKINKKEVEDLKKINKKCLVQTKF